MAYMVKEIFNDAPMEMNALIQSILFLSGTIEYMPDKVRINIKRNEKDFKFMDKLEVGLKKMNSFKIRHHSGNYYEFVLV